MTPYEVMMSESQERMLLVVTPDAADDVNRIVDKWSLHSAVIGTVTDDGMVRILDDGEPSSPRCPPSSTPTLVRPTYGQQPNPRRSLPRVKPILATSLT